MTDDQSKQIELQILPPFAEIIIKSHAGINILHTGLLRSFNEILQRLKENGNVKAALLSSGSGNGFAAGADMLELKDLSCETSAEFSSLGQMIFAGMSTMPVIFIAVVEGYCIGGGFDMILACDIVITSERSYFQHPGVMRGFITGFGGNNRFRCAAGARKSATALMRGEKIDAARSRRYGVSMTNAEFSSAKIFARSVAEEISLLSYEQIELIKRSIRSSKGIASPQKLLSESRSSFLLSLRS